MQAQEYSVAFKEMKPRVFHQTKVVGVFARSMMFLVLIKSGVVYVTTIQAVALVV